MTEQNGAINRKQRFYQVYVEERKALIEAKLDQTHFFDKAILTLTAGAFGLSLALVRYIAPDPEYTPLLAIAWAGFGLSLLLTLTSFLTSQHACEKQIEILEAQLLAEGNQDENEHSARRIADRKNPTAIWTGRLNWASIVFFFVGIVFLADFSILNLSS